MRLFQILFGFIKSNSNRKIISCENVEMQNSNDDTLRRSEETTVSDIREIKASLDQQIFEVSKKAHASGGSTSEDSVIDRGARVPKGTNNTDLER